jgi:hypothetical protein
VSKHWEIYWEFFFRQWRNAYKRGNHFPTGPIWRRLIHCHRMGANASSIVKNGGRNTKWLKRAFKRYSNAQDLISKINIEP